MERKWRMKWKRGLYGGLLAKLRRNALKYHQHHAQVYLRYLILGLCNEYGAIRLPIISALAVGVKYVAFA